MHLIFQVSYTTENLKQQYESQVKEILNEQLLDFAHFESKREIMKDSPSSIAVIQYIWILSEHSKSQCSVHYLRSFRYLAWDKAPSKFNIASTGEQTEKDAITFYDTVNRSSEIHPAMCLKLSPPSGSNEPLQRFNVFEQFLTLLRKGPMTGDDSHKRKTHSGVYATDDKRKLKEILVTKKLFMFCRWKHQMLHENQL